MATTLYALANTQLTGKETHHDWKVLLEKLESLELERAKIWHNGQYHEDQGDWRYEVMAENPLPYGGDGQDPLIVSFYGPYGYHIDLYPAACVIGTIYRYNLIYEMDCCDWLFDFRKDLFSIVSIFGAKEVIYLADNSCDKLGYYLECMIMEGVSYANVEKRMREELGQPVTDLSQLNYNTLTYDNITEFVLDTFEYIRDGKPLPVVLTPETSDNPYLHLGHNMHSCLLPFTIWYERLKQMEEVPTTRPTTNSQYVRELKQSTEKLKTTYQNLFQLLQDDMPRALGALGDEPDQHAMTMVMANLVRCCTELQAWEKHNLQLLPAAARLKECRLQLRGYTKPTIDELHRFANYLVAHFSQENPSEPDFEMNLVPGADIKRINKLMDSFIENPEPDPLKRPRTSFSSKVLHYLGVLWVADLFRSERD